VPENGLELSKSGHGAFAEADGRLAAAYRAIVPRVLDGTVK
jgi:hypothetical protein